MNQSSTILPDSTAVRKNPDAQSCSHPLAAAPAYAGPIRVALIGGGYHAAVVADCIRAQGTAAVAGYTDPAVTDDHFPGDMSIRRIGVDHDLAGAIMRTEANAAILGMAGLRHVNLRMQLVESLTPMVPYWWTAVHPSAVIATSARIQAGAVVFAAAVVNPCATIGTHAVLNTGAIVEHHCIVEAFAVVSPRAVLCGGVQVGVGAFIGAGAIILEGRWIGAGAVVAAGAVIRADVPAGTTVYPDQPAKPSPPPEGE